MEGREGVRRWGETEEPPCTQPSRPKPGFILESSFSHMPHLQSIVNVDNHHLNIIQMYPLLSIPTGAFWS